MDVEWLAATGIAVAVLPTWIGIADRGLQRLATVGRWPSRLRRYDHARAKRIVEAEERDRALDELAENSKLILAEVRPNGGASMRDEIRAMGGRLDHHVAWAEEQQRGIAAGLQEIREHLAKSDQHFESHDGRLDAIERRV